MKTKDQSRTPAATDVNVRDGASARRFFPLTRKNFLLMGVAGVLIVLGFVLMLGAGSTDETFNPGIFSARRVVVGPTISFLGYLFMGVAIMWNPRKVTGSTSPAPDDNDVA